MSDPYVRWLIRSDMPEVLALDGADGVGWGEDEILRYLRDRKQIGFVAERGEKLVGFILYHLGEQAFEVDRLAGDDAAVRGLVKRLLEKTSGRRRRVEIWIEEQDLGKQLVLRGLGVRAVEVCPYTERILFVGGDKEKGREESHGPVNRVRAYFGEGM